MLGGGRRREEHLLSWTRVCVDRVGAYDGVSDRFFHLPFPPISDNDRSCTRA
jgi:hypothetical protein